MQPLNPTNMADIEGGQRTNIETTTRKCVKLLGKGLAVVALCLLVSYGMAKGLYPAPATPEVCKPCQTRSGEFKGFAEATGAPDTPKTNSCCSINQPTSKERSASLVHRRNQTLNITQKGGFTIPDGADDNSLWETADDKSKRDSAVLVVDTDALQGTVGTLAWRISGEQSFVGPGLTHMLYRHSVFQYDCLQVSRATTYHVAVQLTYQTTYNSPDSDVRGYFSITRYSPASRRGMTLGRNYFYIPRPELRSRTHQESHQINRRFRLSAGDKVCVTSSNVELIYLSTTDNYFSIFPV